MNYNEYLKSILTKEQIKNLKNKNKIIIIDGPQIPAGKSVLKKVLQKQGYTVFESYEIEIITLDKRLEKLIPNMEDTISY